MYGQPAASPPYVPAPKPPKPGPTGPGVAIASACVPVVYVVVNIALRWFVEQVHVPWWVSSLAFGALLLIPLVYLVVVGRGAAAKIAAGGLIAIAMVLGSAVDALVHFVDGYPTWLEMVVEGAFLLMVLSVIVAWGLARRSGALWTISIPVGIVMWALTTFVVLKLSIFWWSSSDEPSFLVKQLSLPVWVVLDLVVPIMVGWGLEVLSRGSGGGSAAPRYEQPLGVMQQPFGQGQYPRQSGPVQRPQYGQRPGPQPGPIPGPQPGQTWQGPQQGPPRY